MKPAVLAAMLALTLAVWPEAFAQTKPAKSHAAAADRDQLGMTCAQILAMSSADWIAHFGQQASDAGSEQEKALRAIAVYGKCYDARTDRLAATEEKKGIAPLMGARANFRDLEQALESFTAKGLAVNDPPADAVKAAYAGLYEKQFRYALYENAEIAAQQRVSAKRPAAAAQHVSATATVPRATATSPPATKSTETAAAARTGAADSVSAQNAATASGDADPMTLAKNHFGELLDTLPGDKMHELHSSFGDIMSRGEMSEEMRLAVYRYAIFVLESAKAQPFSPPPF
jgi:hypothetical protein